MWGLWPLLGEGAPRGLWQVLWLSPGCRGGGCMGWTSAEQGGDEERGSGGFAWGRMEMRVG